METDLPIVEVSCLRCATEEAVCNDIPVSVESESESDGHEESSENDDVSAHTVRTVPPMHVEEEIKNEEARVTVLNTCSQLLLSVEAIKMSLLQLQYSLHAGDLGVPTAETKNPSRRIWGWDHPDVLAEQTPEFAGNVFDPANIVGEELTLPHGVYDVFEGGCITINSDVIDDVADVPDDLAQTTGDNAESRL